MIEGIEYFPDASLTVFNRWGQVIHQVNSNINASNAWDGKNDNGEEVEDGVYYYIITLSRAKRVLKGYITVVRDTGRQ
jgi:gliding motility-associated-like protein